jgi:hypothetical protein
MLRKAKRKAEVHTAERRNRAKTSVRLTSHRKVLQQLAIVDLFGTIEYDPTYDYKAERRKRRFR